MDLQFATNRSKRFVALIIQQWDEIILFVSWKLTFIIFC